jgi:hypothetical protein
MRSVTGRVHHFEPLNAKQIERPSHVPRDDLQCAGCEPVEETGQGFAFHALQRGLPSKGGGFGQKRLGGSRPRPEPATAMMPASGPSGRIDGQMKRAATNECCAFCGRLVSTNGHHVVPRCKGGTQIVPTCRSCEDFIHKTWSHNELRDTFNTIEGILADARFQRFLKWLHKQQGGAVFWSRRNRGRVKSHNR